MCKSPALVISLIVALLLFSGHFGSPPDYELASFRNQDGAFAYPATTWGSSPEEVAKAAKIDLADAAKMTATSGRTSEYILPDSVRLYGHIASAEYQFIGDEFAAVSLTFHADQGDLDALFDRVSGEACPLFGEPEESIREDAPPGEAPQLLNGRRWRHTSEQDETTMLHIGMIGNGGQRALILHVGVLRPIV